MVYSGVHIVGVSSPYIAFAEDLVPNVIGVSLNNKIQIKLMGPHRTGEEMIVTTILSGVGPVGGGYDEFIVSSTTGLDNTDTFDIYTIPSLDIQLGKGVLNTNNSDVVLNLNADLWDGNHLSNYLDQGVKATSTVLLAKVGIGYSPSALLHFKAGTASAGTAPIKLNSGVDTTVAVAGQIEYDGINLHFTAIGTLRESIHFGSKGSGILTAGTTTTITTAGTKATSVILIQPTSSAITLLGFYVSTKNAGSFVLTHGTAAGSEAFDWVIIN